MVKHRFVCMLGRCLRSRHMPAFAAVLVILLTLPALRVGWILDDYYHRSVLLAKTPLGKLLGPPSSMFRFFRGDGDRARRLIDMGLFPWWMDPKIKAEFLQALTVLTHRLDYALWPDSPVLMHAHSLLWLGTAVAVTAAFYRRMFGARAVAGIAALLFALDDARGATAGFLANRNVLIAASFGVAALIAHDRWRRESSRIAAFLAPVLLLAALFAKEEGIGTCAYLAAYGLFIDPKGRWNGLFALTPSALVVIAWRAVGSSWGYGVHDTGIYIDPLNDPTRFLAASVDRIPILLLGQWTPIQADLAIILSPSRFAWLWSGALGFLVLLLFAVAPLLKRDLLARFWAAGMVFAAVPVSATFPMDRLLTFVGIGASGLLAQFLVFVLGGSSDALENRLWRSTARVLAWTFVIVHLAVAPVLLPIRAANPVGPAWVEHRLYVRTVFGTTLTNQTVVVVNAPSPAHAGYLILQREAMGQSVPQFMRVLAPAIPSVTIRRLDARALAIRPQRGYLRFILDQVFRSEKRLLRRGEQIKLPGMTVTITEFTADIRPAEVTFRFDVPLESPSFVWLCYRNGRFEPFKVPAIGEETEIRFDWRAILSPARFTSAP